MPKTFRLQLGLLLLAGGLLAGFTTGRAAAASSTATPQSAREAQASYTRTVVPLLSRYCYSCHGNGKEKGDLRLDAWPDPDAMLQDRAVWERVLRAVERHEMPPSSKPQPSARERELLAAWIDRSVFDCDCNHPDPGRVTLRRLNRTEYNNTIRDLIGVDFKPAEDFPVDDSGHGFDNIGDALSLPPVLVEKYLSAAQKILDTALGPVEPPRAQTNRYPVDLLEVGYNAKQRGDGWVALNSVEEDDVALNFNAPVTGDYALRVHAWARQDGTNPVQLTFMRGPRPLEMAAVETNAGSARVYETSITLPAGHNRLRAVVRRNKDGLSEEQALIWKKGPEQKGVILVEWLEVVGPLDMGRPIPTVAHEQIFSLPPKPGQESLASRAILERFTTRAWRRPVAKEELNRLVALADAARRRFATQTNGIGEAVGGASTFEKGVRIALQAVLVSPHFLFRGELQPQPDNPKSAHPINEFALASRLSYFLWSTMPDDELFALAAKGRLRKNLESQVNRMLRHPKAEALAENFAGQWLQTRSLDLVTPDPGQFPKFDEALRAAMKRETKLFFEFMQREDRSVLDFLDADYTFVNARLARHYGLPFPPETDGDAWVQASLKGTPRRGVLTQAGILTLTSNPTRTSPVKRGKWVLENVLNAPPPPPPPNVPQLKEGAELKGTLRQRMEQHRADPLCASCHERMDAIGFSLENFDGIGAWRAKDGAEAIDAQGQLSPEESFNGAGELISLLARQRREQFARCLSEKMLTYALGRGLEYYDKCAVDEITRRLAKQNYRFSALVLEIARSVPFQQQRGDGGGGR